MALRVTIVKLTSWIKIWDKIRLTILEARVGHVYKSENFSRGPTVHPREAFEDDLYTNPFP